MKNYLRLKSILPFLFGSILALLISVPAMGQTFVETFGNLPGPNGSYQTETWAGDNGFGTWTATDARTDRTINGSAITVRNGELTSPTINGGISYLALTTERQFGGGSGDLDVLINGNLVGTIAYSGSVEMDTIFNIDVSGDFTIVIETPGNGDRIAMDDLTWEEYTPPTMGFVETFTNLSPNGSYQTVTWPGDNGFGTWTATDARTDRTINGSAITVRNGELTSPTINGGISYLALTTERQFSGGSGDLDVLINGNLVGTIAYSGSVEMDTIFNIDVAGDFTIVIETPGNGDRIAMDDLTWAEFASGPPPVATEPIPYMDNFDTDPFTNGWTAFSVTGDEAWEYGANFQNVSMSAFSGGCNENEDWFISPAFDFDAQTDEELDVDVSRGFAGDNDLELLYSTDYDGVSDPNTATWTTITTITNDFFDNNSIPDNQAVNFGVFNDLESVSGIGYVAFRFDYSTGSCATWRVNGFNLAIGGLPLACPLLEFNCFGASQSFSGWEGEGVSNDPAQGQLCTEQLAFFGLSSGNVNFGGENTGGDYSRGITTPGVTTGGLYALPYNGGVDTALYFQPTGSDFTPGGFIVKACNETGSAQNRFSIGYDFLKYNDQDRSMVIEVEVSNDNIAYVSVPQLADTIDQPADVPASIEISQLLFDSIDITVDTNQCLFVRFTVDDFTGGGSRPEMGFDNITIEPVSSLAAGDVAISDCVQDSATVSFEITGGIDPIRINGEDVSNLTFGDFSGGVFTSDPIADSSSFQFFVSDNNACSVDPVIVSGEILCDPCVDMEEPDAINPIAVCEGEEITLTPEGGGINNTVEGYRFYEDTTSAPIAEGQTYAFTPLDSTILFVSAFTTGPDCESGYVPVEIAVNNLPVIDGTVTNEGCPGAGDGSIMLNVMATTPSFEWTGPNNFSSQEQNIMDLEPGSYNVIVTDQNGCSNSASFSVEEGEDLEAPIFVACAADITLGCTDDITPSATGEPEVDDNCDPNPDVSFEDEVQAGNCEGTSTILRSWIVADAEGNSSACVQTITISDQSGPTLSCPTGSILAELDENGEYIVDLNALGITASDECSQVGISVDPELLTCSDIGTQIITVTSEDDCGNISTCEITLEVEDNLAPLLICPSDQTINLDAGECTTFANWDQPEAFDNCEGSGTGISSSITSTFAAGNRFAGNMFDVTNVSAESITIDSFLVHIGGTVGANAQVEFYSTPGTFVGNETNAAAWDLFVDETVSSNGAGTPTPVPAGGLVLESGERYGIYFNLANYALGTITAEYSNGTQTENDGNLEFVSGVGKGTPTFTGATFQNRIWNGTIFYSAGSAGTGDVIIEQVAGPQLGQPLDIGSYIVEYKATDVNGNMSTCSFEIFVEEFPNPSQTLACNDAVNVTVDDNCSAIVSADMVLEGGPYGCYKDYIVQLATDMQFNNIIAEAQPGDEGAIVGGAQVGNTYFVRVIDPETGNSCWGEVTIEDKLIPALECGTYAAACEASTDPDATITVEPAFLTASEDTMEIEQFQAIACPGGDYSYLRVIDLAAQGITGEFTPQLFRMGVKTSTGEVDATLRFYRFTDPSVYDPTAPGFAYADLEQIGSDNNGTIPALDFEFWELPVADVTVPGGTQYLVWELEVPGGNFADFVMGSNTLGETSPTYLASDFCGNPDPVQLSSVGAFNGNWVSMVFGEAGGGIPFPLPEGTTVTPTTGEGPFVVSGFDPCGDVTLSFEDNVVDYPECTGDFVSTIFRDWTAIDESGNVSTCQDTINVTRSSLNDVVLPPNFDGLDEDALACDGDNWDENENGFPDPDETGVPNSMLCENILGTFDDHVIDVCEGTFKVLRNWTFVDWCTGETIDHLQVIKVEDVEGPEIECPATATISTAANSCIATYSVPDISGNITDECSPSSSFWTVESSAGEVIDFGNQVFQIIDLPVGTHTLTYTADDGCGNLATCEQTLIVQDAVPPVAVCDQNTKVTLGADGTARVFWPTFEDGSYDNCAIDRIEVTNES